MKTLLLDFYFNASLEDVYDALTNPLKIEEYTEDIADFNPRPGGKFSYWNGNIIGKVKEISKNKINLEWKEETWDEYTRVSIRLSETDGKTKLELIHKDIPDEFFSSIMELWKENFFEPLKEYLEPPEEEEED